MKLAVYTIAFNEEKHVERCYDLLSIAGWYLDKKDEAINYCQKAITANPEDARLKNNLKWM